MKNFGLPKACLLRKNREFDQVYAQGERRYGEGFTIVFRPNGLGFNRMGISIHRQLKGAVRRNRIKRIIRESFRLHRQLFPAGADIVMAVKPGFSAGSTEAVTRAVSSLGLREGVHGAG